MQMAGKSGTAQVRRITMAERRRGVLRNEALPWHLRDHALFIAYAPTDAPRYAAAVVIEHGIGGSAVAAPIARDMLTYLFEPQRAMDTLQKLEPGWGGDIRERMDREAAAWQAAKAAPRDNAEAPASATVQQNSR